ncbi:DUF6924 domain-containing protein [Streptomyces virginiae]
MRPPLPPVAERDEFEALIIRTDHVDEQGWQAVIAALIQPWGERDMYVVDDPAWSGATVDEVLQAVSADEELSVFFLADHVTMRSARHALLAVTTIPEEEYEESREFGREFRTTPAGVHDIHANLSIANMDFEDYAAAAHEDPEKVFSSF